MQINCGLDHMQGTIMKMLIVLALAAVASARTFDPIISDSTTAYGYIQKYGIPMAEKIRKAEEEGIQGRIVGGIQSQAGDFPYQAGLLANFVGITGTGVCGGSLVSHNRVLTAAHCWFDGTNQAWRFTVVLGSTTLFTGGTRIESSAVVMHPNWFPLLVRNDVAVIYLPNVVTFSNLISPIAFPTGNELTQDFVGATAVASGFGLTSDGGSITTNQFLSHVSLNVISNNVCAMAFPFNVVASNICTSGIGGTSPCSGDSGGPLVTNLNNRPVIVGIVSFGSPLGCGVGMPAVFARVTTFMDFFNQNID